METESRWGKRFKTSLKARYGLENLNDAGIVHDISMFGFFIMTSQVYPDGSVIKIQILTPEKEHIHLEGVVQWSVKKRDDVKWLVKDSGMGIKIKRFQAGEEHFAKICQKLCQRKAVKAQNSERVTAPGSGSGKRGLFGRFFCSKSG
jgi:PilZ domain